MVQTIFWLCAAAVCAVAAALLLRSARRRVERFAPDDETGTEWDSRGEPWTK